MDTFIITPMFSACLVLLLLLFRFLQEYDKLFYINYI